MILQMFAVVDRVTGIFDGPHKSLNEQQFLRSFANSVNKEGEIKAHPEDFYAAHLGTYDDSTGQMVANEDGARRICDASDFVNKTEK